MTGATARLSVGHTDVTGLASARAYAAGMTQAFAGAAAEAELFVAGLDGYGVHGPAAAAVTRAHELTGQASTAWAAVAGALDRQTAVTEAYLSDPAAGGKQFLTGHAAPPTHADPVSAGPPVTRHPSEVAAPPRGARAARPASRSFRLIDIMCDRHRDLVVGNRIWPPGYRAGNQGPQSSCAECADVGRRQPAGRAAILPWADEDEHVAYHEAGHVVACQSFGAEIDYVTIALRADTDAEGHVSATLAEEDQFTEDHLLVLLAGQAAARRWLIEERQLDDAGLVDVVNGSASDLADALDDGWTLDEITSALAVADAFIDQNWDAIELVADLLLTRGRVAGTELAELLRGQREVVAASLAAVRATEAILEALSAQTAIVDAALSQTRWTRIGGVAGVISAVLALVALVAAIVIG